MRGSRNFRQGGGGGGGPGPSLTKKALTTLLFFFSPQLIFTEVKWSISKNLSFFKVSEGVQHFPGGGGGPTFSSGGPIAYSL